MDVGDIIDQEDRDCQDEDDNWNDWEDESTPEIICFFCQQTFQKPGSVLKHCAGEHDFDIRQFCADREQLSYIRLINFIRAEKPAPCFLRADKHPWLDSDEFLCPVDPEDPMLQFDVDDLDSLELPRLENGTGDLRIEELISKFREAENRAEESERKLASALEELDRLRGVVQSFILAGPAGPSAIQALTKEEDSGYVQPYGHYSIHQEMLQDKVRTGAYGDFNSQNAHLFKDKIVLDIGCGTGILSLFAAKAGAKKVFAVDHSDIYMQARDIVHENEFSNVIEVLHGKVEDLELPVDEVDIIISEWMGYFLLFESMLDTIIFARERWLKDGGCVYPDQFTISLVGCGDQALYERNVDFWDDVYGFKMSCMRELVVREAAVEVIKSEELITNSAVVKRIDANTITLRDVDFTSEFSLTVNRKGAITSIIGYFDTIFSKNAEKLVEFSTGPNAKPTHWKQTVFLVSPPIAVEEGEEIQGCIVCKKNPQDPRSLKVALTLNGKTRKYVVE